MGVIPKCITTMDWIYILPYNHSFVNVWHDILKPRLCTPYKRYRNREGLIIPNQEIYLPEIKFILTLSSIHPEKSLINMTWSDGTGKIPNILTWEEYMIAYICGTSVQDQRYQNVKRFWIIQCNDKYILLFYVGIRNSKRDSKKGITFVWTLGDPRKKNEFNTNLSWYWQSKTDNGCFQFAVPAPETHISGS